MPSSSRRLSRKYIIPGDKWPPKGRALERKLTPTLTAFLYLEVVCVCVSTKSLFWGVCLLTTPKVYIFSQKEKLPVSVSVCLSVSLSLTHRKKRAVCACGYKQKKSLWDEPTPCKQKKGCSFSTKKKKYSQHTRVRAHTHTHRNVTLLYVCIIWKMNRQTNKHSVSQLTENCMYACL